MPRRADNPRELTPAAGSAAVHRQKLATVAAALALSASTALGLVAPFATQAQQATTGVHQRGPHIARVHLTPTAVAQAPTSSSSPPHLTYYGGRVLSTVQVIQVLYGAGTYEPEVSRTVAPSIASLYAGIGNSPYLDLLGQYSTNIMDAAGNRGTNQVIGRGSFVAQIPITPSVANDGATIDDNNIAVELQAQVSAGNLPPENGNIVYAMYFPAGKTITVGGQASGLQFCAYHGTTSSPQELYYSVLPDFSTGGMAANCGRGSEFQNVSAVSSHELAEAVTDPEVGIAQGNAPPLAWYDPNPNQGEIGDICNGQDSTVAGGDGATYTVQKEWSNSQNACVSAPAVASSDFGLAAAPASLSVSSGSSGSTSVYTTVTSGSPGTVVLSATGEPAGVTLTFNPASVTAGAASTLTVTASSSQAGGAYPVTITGVEGSASHTITFSLTIIGPGPTGSNRAGLVAVNDGSAWVMSSTGASFTSPALWSVSRFFGSTATLSGDIAGSGHQALVAVNRNSVWAELSTGAGFSAPQQWASTSVTGTRATLLGDVNGDGRADLIAVSDSSASVMLSTGSGFLPPSVWSSRAFFGSVATLVGDVTGDGKVDLVAVNSQSTWVMTSSGSGFSTPALWSTVPFYGGVATLSGDVNGDGKADLVAVNNSSAWTMVSAGGSFGTPGKWSNQPFYGSRATLIGDATGDGSLDLIAVNSSSCWVMAATRAAFSSPSLWSTSTFYGTRGTIVGS